MFRVATLFALLCPLLLPGCGSGTTPSQGDWEVIDSSSLTDAQVGQAERATEARGDLMSQLLSRLTEAIEAGGPASAIAVCQEAAPEIAAEVGDARDVAIGRTSFRLRNPENAPPDWARAFVERREESEQLLRHPDGRLAIFTPIRLMDRCLICHGPDDQIPAEVSTALRDAYPLDQATGFEEGDLRGWFWVEVPPAETEG